MASPQLENGHSPIANELVEALAKTQLSGHESRVMWAIIRKTYGWGKKTDRISFSQMEQLTGLHRRNIAPALQRLCNRCIVSRSGSGQVLEYGLQKDYSLWRGESQTVIENDNGAIIEINNAPLLKTIMVTSQKPLLISDQTVIEINNHKNNIQKQEREKEKCLKRKNAETFEEFVNRIMPQFPALDLGRELERFNLWWSEGGRILQRPKFAFRNWLEKAERYRCEREAKAPPDSGKPKPVAQPKTPTGITYITDGE